VRAIISVGKLEDTAVSEVILFIFISLGVTYNNITLCLLKASSNTSVLTAAVICLL
jgi:hypothetical protein